MKTNQKLALQCSILSGLFASLASVFGKIATSSKICQSYLQSILSIYTDDDDSNEIQIWLIRAIQILAFAAMILVNSIMWTQFSLALAHSRYTIQVTTVNTVTNFICSAIFGIIIFNETITIQWTIGITLILIGIILLKRNDTSIINRSSNSISNSNTKLTFEKEE
ncbi:hypothetical protein DERP_010875 [Dermatophagoides pteronyssinus]|uniref:Transmembrane protein 42-like n=1 Tax=Dermatophagoides pteronyssinus TaxID=6956 RepID=A0ABQ8JUN8_DERPT|nr:hypothetical protein DERP_010875 [Dermatophagoides pteronyssinus]